MEYKEIYILFKDDADGWMKMENVTVDVVADTFVIYEIDNGSINEIPCRNIERIFSKDIFTE